MTALVGRPPWAAAGPRAGSEIPGPGVTSQRNRIVHDYFGLDWTVLYETLTIHVPILRDLRRILETEFPDPDPD